jgi:hypothetical protein
MYVLIMHSPSTDSLCAGGRPTAQTAGRLFAIGPDVVKLFVFVALGKDVLVFISLYLDGNVTDAGEFERVFGF